MIATEGTLKNKTNKKKPCVDVEESFHYFYKKIQNQIEFLKTDPGIT